MTENNDEDYRRQVKAAERLLTQSEETDGMYNVARAQVRATLALAAAIRELDVSTYRVGDMIRANCS